MVLLGPPLGSLLLAPDGHNRFWPHDVSEHLVRPEPTEHARYLLALLGPLLLGVVVAMARRLPVPRRPVAVLSVAGRVALVTWIAAAVVMQHRLTYDASYVGYAFRTVYFTPAALAVSLAIAAVCAALVRRRDVVERLARMGPERARTRVAGFALALLFVATWLLTAFNTDGSIAGVNVNVWENLPFWFDESFAVLNGHAPLVDFHAQYGQLWAYVGAGVMALLGTSFAVYGTTMLVGTAAALIAVYATLRRLTGRSAYALGLFLPFVATSFFMQAGPLENRYGPANLSSLFPMRYGGPFLLLWLVVRRLERRPSRPPVALFAVAGLVAINNGEFGLPAVGATLAALVVGEQRRSAGAFARLCGSALVGIATAVLLCSMLTLTVAGSLPHFGMLATFPRIFAVEGYGMLPMPQFGLHLALYVTFAGALVVALARTAADDDKRLTGALAWSGVFGLGAGAYFVGRSHPHVLVDLFSAWALAIALLVLVTARAGFARHRRWPTVAELLVLAGFGIAVCSLAQTPTPWSQLARIQHPTPLFPGAEAFPGAKRATVAALTHRGEPVALLMREGHRIAEDLGLVNVTPYANQASMLTVEQWQETVQALRRAGGRQLIASQDRLLDEQVVWLVHRGYQLQLQRNDIGITQFVMRPQR